MTEPLTKVELVGPAGPPVAVAVAQQAIADPATREVMKQHAMELGGHAAMIAQHYGHKGVMAFGEYIQQGPKGASTLCFVGGIATSTVGLMYVTGFLKAVTDPLHYLIYLYMFAFGVATTCLEADPDRIGMMPFPFDSLAGPLTRGQAWLHAEVRLLTELRGRGIFYLYQGTLMSTQCVFCLLFLVGIYSAIMGALCIAMSYGITPDFDRIAATTGIGGGGAKYDQIRDEEAAAEDQSITADPASAATYHQQYYSASQKTIGSSMALPPSLTAEFNLAEQAWSTAKEKLPGKACRALWALHNQATTGDCNTKKPSGMFNGNAKEQWRLWNELKGISSDDAKLMFVERLRKEKVSF
jgi:acyl-CoA-binding protein